MAPGTWYLLSVVGSVLVLGTQLRSTETITEVPFELYQRHLVVTKGSIGRLNNLNLLIDTGTIPDGQEDFVAPLELVWPFVTVRMTIAGQPVRLLVDTGNSNLVLFKTRMPAALSDAPWRGDKTIQSASGPARLRRLDLRQVGLGMSVWEKLPAWSLDRVPLGYPPDIDGMLGVMALGCQRVRFDFERSEFG